MLQLRKVWSKIPIVAVSFDTTCIHLLCLLKTKKEFLVNYYAYAALPDAVFINKTSLHEANFVKFLQTFVSSHKLEHAYFAWSINDKYVNIKFMQLPVSLTPLEKFDLIKFELESTGNKIENYDANIYFDFHILGKSKKDKTKEDTIVYFTKDHSIKKVINVFKLANLNLNYIDIDSLAHNKITHKKFYYGVNPFENMRFSHKINQQDLIKTAYSWILTVAIAMRVLEQNNINLLPWRQINARKIHIKRNICKSCMLIILIVIESYRYYLSSKLNNLESLKQQQIEINQKITNKIESIHARYKKILTKVEEIQALKTKQRQLLDWFEELVTTLPAGVMLTSVEMKINNVKLIARTYEYKDISNFIANLTQSKCFVGCHLKKIESSYRGKAQRLSYMFHLQLTLKMNHFCQESKT